eukprot:g8186.t1
MSSEQGAGRASLDIPPGAYVQNGRDEETSGDDDNGAASAASVGQGRPACLPLPSPPRLPSKKPLSERLVDSTAAKFKAKCTVSGGGDGGGGGGGTGASTSTSAGGRALAATTPVVAVLPPPWGTGGGTVDVEARERTAQAWIEAVSGKACVTFETKQFARNLMSGEILCTLVNAIRPGTIPHVHESQLGFEQVENIDNFLSACCKLGVPPHALVDTADIFEMRDTPRVVECVHALGSAVQVSCPAFAGPHLGPAADPSLVAAVPAAGDENKKKRSEGSDGDDDDDDGAFGDFWRASVRDRGGTPTPPGEGKDETGAGRKSLSLSMQDVERPLTARRGFTTTVGSITDLDPPSTLSARARKMCPEEMINSPRALVFNSDPIGHPIRSPTMRAAWESEMNTGGGRSAWGTDIYPVKRGPKAPSNLPATSSRSQTLSPAGGWGIGAAMPQAGRVGKSVSPAAATPGSSHITTTDAAVAPKTQGKEPETTGGDPADSGVAFDPSKDWGTE